MTQQKNTTLPTMAQKHRLLTPENIREYLVLDAPLQDYTLSADGKRFLVEEPITGGKTPTVYGVLDAIYRGLARIKTYGTRTGILSKIKRARELAATIRGEGRVPLYDLSRDGRITIEWEDATIDDLENLEEITGGYERDLESIMGTTPPIHADTRPKPHNQKEVRKMTGDYIDWITRDSPEPQRYYLECQEETREDKRDTGPFAFLYKEDAHGQTVEDVIERVLSDKTTRKFWEKEVRKYATLEDLENDLYAHGFPDSMILVAREMWKRKHQKKDENLYDFVLREPELFEEEFVREAYLNKVMSNAERLESKWARVRDRAYSVYDRLKPFGGKIKRGLQNIYNEVKKDKGYLVAGVMPAVALGATLAGEWSGSQAYIDATWYLHDKVTTPLFGGDTFVYRPLQGALAGSIVGSTIHKISNSGYGARIKEKLSRGLSRVKSLFGGYKNPARRVEALA